MWIKKSINTINNLEKKDSQIDKIKWFIPMIVLDNWKEFFNMNLLYNTKDKLKNLIDNKKIDLKDFPNIYIQNFNKKFLDVTPDNELWNYYICDLTQKNSSLDKKVKISKKLSDISDDFWKIKNLNELKIEIEDYNDNDTLENIYEYWITISHDDFIEDVELSIETSFDEINNYQNLEVVEILWWEDEYNFKLDKDDLLDLIKDKLKNQNQKSLNNTNISSMKYNDFEDQIKLWNTLFFQNKENSFFIDKYTFQELEKEDLESYILLWIQKKWQSRFDFFHDFLKNNIDKKIILENDDLKWDLLEFVWINWNSIETNYWEYWDNTWNFHIKNVEKK